MYSIQIIVFVACVTNCRGTCCNADGNFFFSHSNRRRFQ